MKKKTVKPFLLLFALQEARERKENALSELHPNELALYHFYQKGDGCYGRELPFDKQGRLKEGLPDFFEANIDQFKRYLDAFTKKKGK